MSKVWNPLEIFGNLAIINLSGNPGMMVIWKQSTIMDIIACQNVLEICLGLANINP
jgi:hypothetical protein